MQTDPREIIARQQCRKNHSMGDTAAVEKQREDALWESYLPAADAILTALAEAGVQLVRRDEPTPGSYEIDLITEDLRRHGRTKLASLVDRLGCAARQCGPRTAGLIYEAIAELTATPINGT